ncbi:hypothetical protein ACO4C2_02960 [Streptococcus equinus]|uniref:hypothetical protein n=1 Tax=Streptococcus equinus TaxID=1335 RepID=UPI003C6EC211
MFLNLDNILKNTGYSVSDDEIVKAFKNLGYVSIAETNKEIIDSLNNLNKATAMHTSKIFETILSNRQSLESKSKELVRMYLDSDSSYTTTTDITKFNEIETKSTVTNLKEMMVA